MDLKSLAVSPLAEIQARARVTIHFEFLTQATHRIKGARVSAIPSLSVAADEPLTTATAFDHVYEAALTDAEVGTVGIELETHLVDLAAPAERVAWHRIEQALPAVKTAARTSAVTFEPGGQLELSSLPASGVVAAIDGLRLDEQRVRLVLADYDLGLAHVGCDPIRSVARVNPRSRYQAMEQHYRSTGQSEAGLTMMCATAAMQVNLQAGKSGQWSERVALAHALGPVFIAIAANSSLLSGTKTQWKSLRRRVWSALDPHSCAPLDWTDDPAASWTSFALQAPATLVSRADGGIDPVGMYVPFLHWVTGAVRLGGRRPTINDLQTHLSTLFPPVRLRGYLEIRYLDTVGPRWWPAVAAALTTLIDVPTAADAAADIAEETATLWETAAEFGLADERLARAAQRCMEIAAAHAPTELRFAVEDLASLVAQRRCPGDEFADRVDDIGALAAFEELARA